MVTILRPRKRRPSESDIASGTLPDDAAGGAEQADAPVESGVELSVDESTKGTGSAPGEGPNPTA
ncbi:MAG TPA: hypothetical protein VLC92_13255 [Rhodocyclaceae bacterium]|nr:hypothetical protein [Rhodocyclaceae bacterium]